MEILDNQNQIQELIRENLPDCFSAVKIIEDEFKNCPHPPSFIYRLNQNILKVKSLILENKNLNRSYYLNELLGSLRTK